MADVLIMDDDPGLAGMLASVLRAAGLTVDHFQSAAGVLELVREGRPGLVVLDIMMPGLDGLSACRAIRSDPLMRDVKIAVVTGKVFAQDKEEAFRSGADLFLTKPFDAGQFARDAAKLVRPGPPAAASGERQARATLLAGGIAVERERSWLLLDAGAGLGDWIRSRPSAPPAVDILLTRPGGPADLELSEAAEAARRGAALHLAGPEDGGTALRESGARLCTDGEGGARTTPRLTIVREGEFSLHDGVRVSSLYTHHPGVCVAYRVELPGCALVYCPENDLAPALAAGSENELWRFRRFIGGADVLVHGFRGADGWRLPAELARRAGVQRVLLVPERGAPVPGPSLRLEGESPEGTKLVLAPPGHAETL